MTIEVLPRAEDDIVRQFRYYLVERDAVAAAIRFRESVKRTLKLLTVHPKIGSSVQCSIAGLRSWPVQGFFEIRIYYIETANALRVVRVLHGRQRSTDPESGTQPLIDLDSLPFLQYL